MQPAQAIERIKIENILYPTDFSRQSEAALPFVLSLARRYGSAVFPAHIISLPAFSSFPPTQALQSIAAQALREAQEAMRRLEPHWEGIPHEQLLRRGNVWQQLTELIDEKKIDLVVTGTHGRTGVSKVLMGSTAESIFRQASCPVLTVGPNVCGEAAALADIRTILCPIDFGAESRAAVPYAISLAAENDARLYLLHVTEDPVAKATETLLKDRLLRLVPPEAQLSSAPTAYVNSGVASQRILELVEELALDALVLGVKATPGFAGASTHLGMATAYKVVTSALCPVLTVRKSRAA